MECVKGLNLKRSLCDEELGRTQKGGEDVWCGTCPADEFLLGIVSTWCTGWRPELGRGITLNVSLCISGRKLCFVSSRSTQLPRRKGWRRRLQPAQHNALLNPQNHQHNT